jgi:hypothetical protein
MGLTRGTPKQAEILRVAGYDRKAMFKGRRRDHAIGGVSRGSAQLTCSVDDAPAAGDFLRHRQNAPVEP